MVRAFVAVDVPPIEFDEPGAGPLPTAPAHLTLRFFEELAPDRLPLVTAAVDRAAAATPSFRLTLEGVGAFPNPHSPRVVWVGVGEGRGRLVELARRLSEELAATGLVADPRPFSPHVTLFRVRHPRDRGRALEMLAGPPGRRFGETVVRELVLKESELTRSGAVHRVAHRGPLASAEPSS